jgi:uncharacterized membrane protein
VPALYVIVALALSFVLVRWDEADPIVLVRSISSSSAGAALSALASGMLAFTGFVTSVILMVVQFGTSEFSPRFVAWFRRDRTLKFARASPPRAATTIAKARGSAVMVWLKANLWPGTRR